MNPYVYNPAYAGVDGHPVLYSIYKQQWSKIPESPQLIHVTYHTPLQGGIGIGGTVFRESQGPLTSTSFKATGSYLVNIDRKHFLRFGMSLGLGSNALTIPDDAIGDPAFLGESTMYLIGDFGVSYHFDHFNAGFALPNLFSSEVISEKSLSPFKISPTDNMLFKMNYRGHINHDIAIEPHFIYRFSNVVPSQYEIATILHLKHLFWVGGTYRQYAGLVGLLGAKFNNKIVVGGAFELGSQNYGKLTGSSFEVSVGIHLGGHKDHERKHIGHHSSFFRTHSDKLLEKKAKEEAIARQKEIDDLAKERNRDPDALGNVGNDTEAVTPKDSQPDDPQEWNTNPESISKTDETGEIQTGRKLERTNSGGDKEIIMGFPPPKAGGKAWALAPGASQLLERTKPDGKKEVGAKWVRINENGTFEQTIKWEPVLDEEEAAATIAASIEVVKDPIIKEDPIVEDPVVIPIVQQVIPIDPTVTQEVKRRNNILELAAGNHIIGGAFKEFQQADSLSNKLFHQGFRDVKVGYVSARKHYYVVIRSYTSVERAQQEQSRMKSSTGLKDVWVLKVNN